MIGVTTFGRMHVFYVHAHLTEGGSVDIYSFVERSIELGARFDHLTYVTAGNVSFDMVCKIWAVNMLTYCHVSLCYSYMASHYRGVKVVQ